MRIKELREQRNILQKDLALDLGIATNTLSQYETGKREPDLETMQRIADFFGVSVDELLGRKGQEKAPTPKDERPILAGTYFRLAKGAEELGLNDDDVDAILNLYKRHKERNS